MHCFELTRHPARPVKSSCGGTMRAKRSSPVSLSSLGRSILHLTLLSIVCCLSTFAQIDRAVLEGAVTDPTGAAIVGATVKVLAVDTGISQEKNTNSNGYYQFPGLAVGRYTITISGKNFKTQEVSDVVLRIGQTRTLDVALAVGAAD